jgi:hypothetical protein
MSPTLPHIVSGAVACGATGHHPPGAWQSGGPYFGGLACGSVGVYPPPPVCCASCGAGITSGGSFLPGQTQVTPYVYSSGVYASLASGHSRHHSYCALCMGVADGLALTREYWIREGVPLAGETPACIVADWLYDHSRQADGDWMMALHLRRTANREGGT